MSSNENNKDRYMHLPPNKCIPFIDPPDEPCKLKVVDSTKTSITLGWSKPEWDGGSEVTSYVVEKLIEGEEEWAVITSKGEVKTTEYTVHDLKPDVNYFFRVSAINCAGRGDPLEMTEPVQAKDILGKLIIDIENVKCVQFTIMSWFLCT